MEIKFFKCLRCGQIVAKVKETGAKLVCCGQDMVELIPNTTDAANEKHVPVIHQDGNKVVVSVGSVAHPMQDVHYIEWILLATNKGNQRHTLKPNEAPETTFALTEGEEVIAAYAYCNLHGLWKSN